jgi:[ribosomal protein S5]-alanine N-acetyltransferase
MKINDTVFKNFPELETERLFLRSCDKNDTKFLYKIRSSRNYSESVIIKRHTSLSETEKLIGIIESSFKDKTGINWILSLKENYIPIGYACIWNIAYEHLKGEIGYTLIPEYYGNGFMTEAIKEIMNFSFNKLGLHKLEANVDSNNINSIKLLKTLNFKQDAFLREDYLFNDKFHDTVIYSKLERENDNK